MTRPGDLAGASSGRPRDGAAMNMSNAVEELLPFVTGPVLGATMCPGIFLCLPGLALVLVPLVALAAVALLLAAVAATPYLLVRLVRG
jgi:hypothetical protein